MRYEYLNSIYSQFNCGFLFDIFSAAKLQQEECDEAGPTCGCAIPSTRQPGDQSQHEQLPSPSSY